jgi:hypothetical protein
MTIRQSTGLRNFLLRGGSFFDAFGGGKLEIRSGPQPASADDAPTGTLLVTITDASGAHTSEVRSVGSVDLTGGASGSVDTITVNSIEIMGSSTPFNTSLAQTAQDVIDKINRNPKNKLFEAFLSDTDKINIRARPGLGTLPNGWVVASTVTTITKTDANMAGGVNSVNGLLFNFASGGGITIKPGQTWSGVIGTSGTAGWFRFVGPIADAGAADSAGAFARLDGNIATSGADLNLSNTSLTATATETINSFSPTEPAQC